MEWTTQSVESRSQIYFEFKAKFEKKRSSKIKTVGWGDQNGQLYNCMISCPLKNVFTIKIIIDHTFFS